MSIFPQNLVHHLYYMSKKLENLFEGFMFWSRWVQAPMYGGLIFGSFIYLYVFFHELYNMFTRLLNQPVGSKSGPWQETEMMLSVLNLVDISMVMNLLVIVTIMDTNIYERMEVDLHEDKPFWLNNLDAGQLKIKLATSLASITGVQLLKTFVDYREAATKVSSEGIIIEIIIHIVFILSALLLAQTENNHGYAHEKNMTKAKMAKEERENQNLLKYDFDK